MLMDTGMMVVVPRRKASCSTMIFFFVPWVHSPRVVSGAAQANRNYSNSTSISITTRIIISISISISCSGSDTPSIRDPLGIGFRL